MGIIEARGLARTFKSRKRTVEAVRGVDLTVGDGEIVGITLESINLSRPTLDDVFLTLTGRSLRDDSPASRGAANQGPTVTEPEPAAATRE
jgi:ABC-2 type transport system ATP-binding protein